MAAPSGAAQAAVTGVTPQVNGEPSYAGASREPWAVPSLRLQLALTRSSPLSSPARVPPVGDMVFLRPPGKSPPFIGRLDALLPEQLSVVVTWVYRPEDLVCGRKAFHGAREVMISDHSDVVSAGSILGKCRVVSLREYQAVVARSGGSGAKDPALFFTRFRYSAAKKVCTPRVVPAFCSCAMPYNPDSGPMCACTGGCRDWYHVTCLVAAAAGGGGSAPLIRQDGTCVCGGCAAGGLAGGLDGR